MVFLNNMLMSSSHMAFNKTPDWIYDQCCPLHAKITSSCFTFGPIIINPIILVLVLKITWWEVLVVNVVKYSFSWIPFPGSLICKNLNVNSNLICEFKFAKLDVLKSQTRLRFYMQIWQENLFDCAWWEPWT